MRREPRKVNKVRIALYILVATVPLLLFALVQQSVGMAEAAQGLQELEKEQAALVEENKRLLAAIAALESASRTDQVASETLGMEKRKPDAVIRVEIVGDGEKVDG